jgi:hypothetical protein
VYPLFDLADSTAHSHQELKKERQHAVFRSKCRIRCSPHFLPGLGNAGISQLSYEENPISMPGQQLLVVTLLACRLAALDGSGYPTSPGNLWRQAILTLTSPLVKRRRT